MKDLVIYQSELEVIKRHAAESPRRETGGELAGLWTHDGTPIVLFAGIPGPKAVRTDVSFEQDLDHHVELQQVLWNEHRIQILGLWHSHHQLALDRLSSGDINRTRNYGRQHGRNKYCEILTTLRQDERSSDLIVFLHPYVYEDAPSGIPVPSRLVVQAGISPVRSAFGDESTSGARGWLGTAYRALVGARHEVRHRAVDNAAQPRPDAAQPDAAQSQPATAQPTGPQPRSEPEPPPRSEPASPPRSEPASPPRSEPASPPRSEPASPPRSEPASRPRSEPAPGQRTSPGESAAPAEVPARARIPDQPQPARRPHEAMLDDLEFCVGQCIPEAVLPGLRVWDGRGAIELSLISGRRPLRFNARLQETPEAGVWLVQTSEQNSHGRVLSQHEDMAPLPDRVARRQYLSQLLALGLRSIGIDAR